MQLLGLDVDIAGQDVIEDNIFDERPLVVLLVVKILDVSERDGKQLGHLLRHFVLALDKDDIVRLHACVHGTVGVAARCDDVAGIVQLFAHALSDLADANQFGTGNDYAVLVNHADHAVNRVLHLMNDTLK